MTDSSNHPIISVVMPVLNGEDHLSEAIDSVLQQTFSNFELIVVNDGSTDSTPSILQEYQKRDERVRVIRHESKQGLADSINDGIRVARGKYIARLDADDIALPQRFQIQYQFLEAHPAIALVGGGYAAFNEQGHRTNIFHPSTRLHLAWSFLTNTRFCHPSVMFRKSAAETVGLYPKTGAEDFAFFSKLVLQFPCVNLPLVLIRYREHASNYSITAKPAILESVQATYRENYQFYHGSLDGAEQFYHYHTQNTLPIKNLALIRTVNTQILQRARKQYRMSAWSFESIRLVMQLEMKNLRAVIGTLIRQGLVT